MEFVANYDEAQFAERTACENEELTYVMRINGVNDALTGQHSALIAAGAVNAAVDMKIVVTPSSKIEKTASAQAKVTPDISGEKGIAPFFPL